MADSDREPYIEAHDPKGCAVMARAATEAGAIVTADIDNIYAGLTELLLRIDILITLRPLG